MSIFKSKTLPPLPESRNSRFHLTYFDILLALFVFSAFIGTQTAYAPGPAWVKFSLIVGACGLYYALCLQSDARHFYRLLTGGGIFGLALAIYFFAANDWLAAQNKMPALATLGRLLAAPLPALTAPGFNPNVIGGVLAMLLPCYVLLVLHARSTVPQQWPRWLQRGLPFFWLLVAGIVLLTVLVTSSRGAWLAILVGFALWGLWLWLGQWFSVSSRLRWFAGLLILGTALAALGAYSILKCNLPGAGVLTNRLTLFTSSLPLARDYVFTGAGLNTFQMNYSIYTLLIHVGYVPNSHNVFVDLIVEQGVLGLVLYLSLVLCCVWQGARALLHASQHTSRIIEAGLVSLVVILIHGQVEDILYGSQWLLLFFIPFALVRKGVMWVDVPMSSGRCPARRWVFGVGGALFIVLSAVFWRPLLAQGYASMGAMRQARLELADYKYGKTPGYIVDSVRQQADFGEIEALFERAIALDPENATARQRLASIQLSQEEYDGALSHLQAAWAAGHQGTVTRLLLGDALVANGRVNEAAELIVGLYWDMARIEKQAWDRYWYRGDFARAAYAWRTIALLRPQYARSALQRAREAEVRAAPP